MSNPENQHHIVPYRTYVVILLALVTFTFLSILVTRYELGPLAVTAALLFASLKCTLVFLYFMHLKFDERIYGIMVSVVLFLLLIVIVGTFMDYSFR
jgi:cytochrome c oxidase subunit IV